MKISAFGANVALTGGICLQTIETWRNFIETNTVTLGNNSTKLYCEEDDFTDFMDRLKTFDMDYVHDVKEHGWGQGAVRFKDPDKHIIEVGESIMTLCWRFLDSGMTLEETARRMNVPIALVKRYQKP